MDRTEKERVRVESMIERLNDLLEREGEREREKKENREILNQGRHLVHRSGALKINEL